MKPTCHLLLLAHRTSHHQIESKFIDARRRRQGREPRSLMEELAGPAQFKPWVAGPAIIQRLFYLFFFNPGLLGLQLFKDYFIFYFLFKPWVAEPAIILV